MLPVDPHHPDYPTAKVQAALEEPFGSAVEGAPPGYEPAPAARETSAPAGSYVPVAGVEAVLALRMRQIHHFGHTPEADRRLPLRHLPQEAMNSGRAVVEDIQFGKPRDNMRRHAVRAAALWLAFIDRLDSEGEETNAEF